MNWTRFAFMALALVLTACSAAETDDNDAGAAAADAGVAAVDAGAAAADTGATPAEDAGPVEPDNFCINDSDAAAVAATYGDDEQTTASIASSCGLACFQQLGMGITNECVVDCMRTATEGAISDQCLGCFGGSVMCTAQNCALTCAADPSSDACLACQCGGNASGTNCFDQYSACSGLPSSFDCE